MALRKLGTTLALIVGKRVRFGRSADNADFREETAMKILTRKLGWLGVCVVLAILLIALVGLYYLRPFAGRFLDNLSPSQPKVELLAFWDELDWGEGLENVEEILQSGKYSQLRPQQYGPRGAGVWTIGTPSEWGAKNWVLCLQFDEGALVAKRIRIQDTARIHPRGAPDDEVSQADVPCPSWLEIWKPRDGS
jgi:hypothetical protein